MEEEKEALMQQTDKPKDFCEGSESSHPTEEEMRCCGAFSMTCGMLVVGLWLVVSAIFGTVQAVTIDMN